MRRIIARVLITAAVLAGGGLLVAWTGVYSVAASSGHWPIVEWFLHFAMRQSVQTHSVAIDVPSLDDPARLARGAGHYASGCAPCHGAPEQSRAPLMHAMLPPPPTLVPRIRHWQPEELFWLVKHGIKYTGMPGWVARQRDDEVWDMVAFLLRLPGLDARSYRQLAYGEMADTEVRDAVDDCARCHGRNGLGRGLGAFPQLALLSAEYIYASLKSYAAGERFSGVMQPVAAALDDETMRALAKHYSGAAEPPAGSVPGLSGAGSEVDEALLDRGEAIARYGLPRQGVPPCLHCHGPDAVADNPLFPALAGQYFGYLTAQLELWRQGKRGGTAYAAVMSEAVRGLNPEQIREVAAYFAARARERPGGR